MIFTEKLNKYVKAESIEKHPWQNASSKTYEIIIFVHVETEINKKPLVSSKRKHVEINVTSEPI